MPLLKWQFTAVASEEFIVFDPDDEEERTRAITMSASTLIARRSEGQFPTMHLTPIYQKNMVKLSVYV
jgi:hypothetical protein